jgi:hypothetical protein
MFTALLDQAKKSPLDSLETVVLDRFTFIRFTGLCCAEYAQKTQSAVDEHEYSSGKHYVKAFILTDWKLYSMLSKHSSQLIKNSTTAKPASFTSTL